MALLTPALRRARLGVAGLALASCSADSSVARVELWLRDCGEVVCDRALGPRSVRHFDAPAFIDPRVSRFAPRGLYAYFELEDPDGTAIRVELDVPTGLSGPLSDYDVSYREWDGDRLHFEAIQMRGVLIAPSMPEDGGGCSCEQGRFELRFTDPGPDGELGTDDDRERELGGRMGPDETWCTARPSLPMTSDLQVRTPDCPAIPAPAPAPSPITRGPYGPATGSGSRTGVVAVDYDTEPEYAAGCDTHEEETYTASGCEPTSGAAATATASDESGGGCEGDAHEGSSGCEGDRYDGDDSKQQACRIQRGVRRSHARSGSAQAYAGLLLPLLLAYLGLSRRARRAQRACRG